MCGAIKVERENYNLSFIQKSIDVLNKKLNVMDSTATSLCMDNNIPILVFDINKKGNLLKAVKGETIGTIVK